MTALLMAVTAVVVASWHARADGQAVVSGAVGNSGPALALRSGQVDQVDQDTLLVIGDSITSRFNDKPKGKMQGFWSMVARQVGADPVTRAQGGAGFVNPGLVRCKGYTFGGQLKRPAVREIAARAGAVIIEGGRNDTRVCAKGGGYVEVSNARLRRAANRFFADIRSLRGPDDCTVVLTPWGPKGPDNRKRITSIVRKAAKSHGFRFIETADLLTERHSLGDRVHPNRRGNQFLAKRIVKQSFMRTCFA